jgi:hypothetical protein
MWISLPSKTSHRVSIRRSYLAWIYPQVPFRLKRAIHPVSSINLEESRSLRRRTGQSLTSVEGSSYEDSLTSIEGSDANSGR